MKAQIGEMTEQLERIEKMLADRDGDDQVPVVADADEEAVD